MTKASAKKTPPIRKSNSKESSASTLMTGAEMRTPSVNPEPMPHLPATPHAHLAPVVSPDHRPEPLRHSSTISRKDGTDKDRGSKFAFAAHPLQMDVDGSLFVDEGAVKVYGSTFRAQVNKAPRDARKKSHAQFVESYVANDMIRCIQDRAVLVGQRKPDSNTKRRNMFDPRNGGPSRETLMNMIDGVANLAEEIFRSEPRVLKVNQPVIVFGKKLNCLSLKIM